MRSLKREEKWCFLTRCLARATLTNLQCFSLQCHGTFNKYPQENEFLLGSKATGVPVVEKTPAVEDRSLKGAWTKL